MNYQMLLEYYSTGVALSNQELKMLDIELYTQIESIKVSRTQGCIEIAPKHICKATLVCEGSFWITCLASLLDKLSPQALGNKTRGAKVFDTLIQHNYIVID